MCKACPAGYHQKQSKQTKKQKAKCRFDFYQVGSNISMSVYAKKTDPSGCFFRASSHKLLLEIAYDAGMKTYAMDVTLAGPIDPTKCALPPSSSLLFRLMCATLSWLTLAFFFDSSLFASTNSDTSILNSNSI